MRKSYAKAGRLRFMPQHTPQNLINHLQTLLIGNEEGHVHGQARNTSIRLLYKKASGSAMQTLYNTLQLTTRDQSDHPIRGVHNQVRQVRTPTLALLVRSSQLPCLFAKRESLIALFDCLVR
jgi:hypothetical protein